MSASPQPGPPSDAYLALQPLRVPAGWSVGWNTLRADMDAVVARGGVGGSSVFTATHPARRFNIDIEFRPEFDPEGAFHLTVLYQPWSRSERGRRLKDAPLVFDTDAEVVHAFETRSGPALIAALEQWIARCSTWEREGG